MGEVMEVSIVSTDRTMYSELLSFICDFSKIESADCEILRLDNWRYSNQCKLNSLSEIEQWMDSKIITVTDKNDAGSIGINIEKDRDKFIYDVWFNPKDEIDEAKYMEFKERVLDMLRGMRFELACIGREMSVDYSKGYEYAIEKGRGIDCIVVSESVENNYNIEMMVKMKKKSIWILR